jgi:terminase small subunit / prophage DNA-packing protein
MATRAIFAKHIGVQKPAVDQLIHRGIIKEHKPYDGIDIDEARIDYLTHLRSVAGSRTGSAQADLTLSKERARKAKEEADKIAMANAVVRKEMLLRGDVEKAIVAAFARVRAQLLTVPSKAAAEAVSSGSPQLAEVVIRDAIYEVLEELADTTPEKLAASATEEAA